MTVKHMIAAAVIAAAVSPAAADPIWSERRQRGSAGIATTTSIAQQESPVVEQRFVGMWVTADGHIRLELRSDGRYDEARGSRRSAYTGRYAVRGNDLHFVDASGFTATGRVVDGVLTVGPDTFRRD